MFGFGKKPKDLILCLYDGTVMKKIGWSHVRICGITYQIFKCPKCDDRVNLRIR